MDGPKFYSKYCVTVLHNWVDVFVNVTLNVPAMIMLLTKKNWSKFIRGRYYSMI